MPGFLTKQEQLARAKTLQPNLRVAPYPLEPGEAYMNASQRQYFKNILLNWKHVIQNKLYLDAEPDLANNYNQLVMRINKILLNILTREYGFCANCECGIDLHRLEAWPIADLCLTCQKQQERKQKHN